MPRTFSFFPLGSIKPLGWLRNQLQIQAYGLSGSIDEFWPDLGPNSGWLGGSGESWERGPYYLDGLIPLAYLLEDRQLITKVQRWLDWVLDHQHQNGWLGPIRDPHESYHPDYDSWPLAVLLKGLTQFYEATCDRRVLPAMLRVFHFLNQYIEQNPLSTWVEFRWGELILSIFWLYERTGEKELLDLAEKIKEQGFDWSSFFKIFPFTEKIAKGEEGYDFRTHGVNIAMGLKAPGLWHLISHLSMDKEAVYEALKNLDHYHGQVTGVYSSDGHLAGLNPWQGTELCTVVETMFSLEVLISLFGDCIFADRLEKIAFNALPATFSPDMWSHQYDQQVNQVLCSVSQREWTTNWDNSNIYGLEPSFGCCTANMHQGWPKFVQSTWMGTQDGGAALISYAPSELAFPTQNGQATRIIEDTEYPFKGRIRFKVCSEDPVTFPLHFRMPAWCPDAILTTDSDELRFSKPGEFISLHREWKPGERFELNLQMPLGIEDVPSGGVSISRGPLIFSLKMDEEWKPLESSPPLAEREWAERVGMNWVEEHADPPHGYFEVHPKSPWNYGLKLNRQAICDTIECLEKPLGDRPFSPEGSPLELRVKGRRLPDWKLDNHSAGPISTNPIQSQEPLEQLTLIPYGCTNLRVTVFPEVK